LTIEQAQSEASARVRAYAAEDEPGLRRLMVRQYGTRELGKPEYFDWLMREAPGGRPFVAVGESTSTGEIIGCVWYIPVVVAVAGQDRLGYLACNGMVQPEYRNQGIYVQTLASGLNWLPDHVFTYAFVKPAAVKGCQRVGLGLVATVPLLVRPLDLVALARHRVTNPLLRSGLPLAWWLASHTVARSGPIPRIGSRVRITVEDTFDEEFDRLADRLASVRDIWVQRDRAFLSWRFASSSFREYRTLAARVDGRLVGYLVARCAEIGGVRTGLILDLLLEPSDQAEACGRALIAEATSWFAASGVALGSCLMLPGSLEYRLLRQAGYLVCPERFAPQPFRLVARPATPPGALAALAAPDRWFITMANHDAV
jgi:GNAT superfamily N-acetyltransferase